MPEEDGEGKRKRARETSAWRVWRRLVDTTAAAQINLLLLTGPAEVDRRGSSERASDWGSGGGNSREAKCKGKESLALITADQHLRRANIKVGKGSELTAEFLVLRRKKVFRAANNLLLNEAVFPLAGRSTAFQQRA